MHQQGCIMHRVGQNNNKKTYTFMVKFYKIFTLLLNHQ